MYLKNVFLVFVIVLLCNGCASLDPVVTPFGKDTYRVSGVCNRFGRLPIPMSEVESRAINKANEKCASLNKEFMPVSSVVDSCEYKLVFRCLDSNDPEYKRPDWEKSPDITIESK